MSDAHPPLHDVRVLDLTIARAGPTAVRQLSDWGADVIRIEPPRDRGGVSDTRRDGSDHQNLHRGKRCITLDLKTDEGQEILRQLVRDADVVVENFRAPVKARLGLDYETLRAIQPRIILASVSGFGQDGPYRERPGVDQIAQGMAGLMSVTGRPGDGPLRVGTAISDLAAGLYLAFGIVTALYERERSGVGQWLHTSLLESMIAMLDFQAARWLVEGEVPGQEGNDHPTLTPMGTFRAADGHLNIAASSSRMFKSLCEAIGAAELTDRPEYADVRSRTENRAALNAEIEARLAQRTCAEWVETLNAVGVPAGPVLSIDQTFADPQVRHLGIATAVEHPRLGEIRLIGQPLHLERTPWKLRGAAHDRGQDTEAVLNELGYDEGAIRRLREDGVI